MRQPHDFRGGTAHGVSPMLSILIPVFNCDVTALVTQLRDQCRDCGIGFEILIQDDASEQFTSENASLSNDPNCFYNRADTNLGRSKTRNLLAEKATFGWLLFLDADVMPVSDDFIRTYLNAIKQGADFINGGIRYQKNTPPQDLRLRWQYGRFREALSVTKRQARPYHSFLSLNFMAKRTAFQHIRFDETLPNLRHEDTVFSHELLRTNQKVLHIDNPVCHLGIDAFDRALQKEHESLSALKWLLSHNKLPENYLRIGEHYTKVRRWGLRPVVEICFWMLRPFLLWQLKSSRPNLTAFDIYRFGYLCALR